VIRRISSTYQRCCQWHIERAFADLKDFLDMRPSPDRQPRAGAHLRRRARLADPPRHRKKLKAARLDLSATEALTALKSVRVVDIDLGDGTTKRSVTAGTHRAATMLRALGINKIDPPIPPKPGETIM
jgi:hypothetical protein